MNTRCSCRAVRGDRTLKYVAFFQRLPPHAVAAVTVHSDAGRESDLVAEANKVLTTSYGELYATSVDTARDAEPLEEQARQLEHWHIVLVGADETTASSHAIAYTALIIKECTQEYALKFIR
jgi:hypothetical protein